MKIFLKVLSLIVACGIAFLIALGTTKDADFVRVTAMDEATLPILYMKNEDVVYNQLHGYTGDIDMYAACEYVTILPEDRQLGICIDKYNSVIKGLSYEVRSKDGKNLYENTEVKEYSDINGVIEATFNIKNLLDVNEDYILIIKADTVQHGTVSFYTVIRYDEAANLTRKVELVKRFNDVTFDRDNLKDIKKYIETNGEFDNVNYGYINIHASLEMFGYGTLNIKRESNPVVYLEQIDGKSGIIILEFMVSTTEKDDSKDYYNVREVYTIVESTSDMYLMDYERYMQQVFKMEGAVKATSRIDFGISKDTNCEFKVSGNNRFTAFVRDAELYLYNIKSNRLISIFTFLEVEGDNVREGYKNHDIKILDVTKEGDITFAVYGYMNRGYHEGEMGVSVCSYSYETNEISEIKFIPVTCSFSTLKENFGDIYYVDENKTVTLMINGTLYAMDTKSQENTIVIGGLKKSNYSISGDGKTVAYIKDNTIRLYNLPSQTQEIISCNSDETLKNIGYIDNDFIYGIAKNADIIKRADGNTVFPMYKINIINEKMENVKEYGMTGIYVVDFEIVGKRVNLSRAKYNENNMLVRTDSDQLMNKNDNVQPTGTYLRRYSTTARLREYWLQLAGTVKDARKVELAYANKLEFSDIEISKIVDIFENDTKRVYAQAKLYGICNVTKKSEVINREACQENKSLDVCVQIIMNDYGLSADTETQFANGKTATDLIEECPGVTSYNLTGDSLEDALQFVAMDSKVIAKVGYDYYQLITGYTKRNVTVYDPVKAKNVTYTRDEYTTMLEKEGNVLITYK